MQDTHGYSRKPGHKKRKGRECIHIRMDDPVMIFSDHPIDFSGKSEGIFIVWCYFVHTPTQCFYPRCDIYLAVFVNDEVKLDFAAINVLVVVQNDRFYPAAGGDDLEYANGFFHRLSLLSALVLG